MASFADSVTPAAVREGFMTAAASKSVLRVTRALTGERIWDWLHTIGVVSHQELAALLPPVPPLELRQITNDADAVQFLWAGLQHAELFVANYTRHRRSNGLATVLDFGCGCGRLCRYLAMRPDLWTVHACEVNSAHVSWLETSIPAVRPILSPLEPPLPYEDSQFDLVYALSVFSHLPPERAVPWLTELRRILKPSGLLIFTTHGAAALEKAAVSEQHVRLLGLGQRTVDWARDELLAKGVIYSEYSAPNAAVAGAGPNYGSTVVSLDRLREWVGNHLEFIQHDEGGLSA